MRRPWPVLAASILALGIAAGTAAGQSTLGDLAGGTTEPAGSPFHAEGIDAPDSLARGEVGTWTVVLRVPPDHYVYTERTSFELLDDDGVEVLEIGAPEPEMHHDTFLDEDVQVYPRDATFVARFRLRGPATVRGVLATQGCSGAMCFFPQSDTLAIQVAMRAGPGIAAESAPDARVSRPSGGGTRFDAAASRGLGWLLLFVFGAGIATSFTPCVYPMIPITIGIIGARSAGRRSKGFTLSLLYVLGIATTYSVLGTSAALTGSLFGGLLQNPWVVGSVVAIFALMAMSLFGAFELQVPTGVASRLNQVQGSGYPGAFLVGLIAGVVASPCIGPVLVGMLAYVAATGSAVIGFTLFFTFALGLGVLFIVLGTFTGMIASLPKSGNWMRWVRIVFGVLLLGVALYYIHPLLPHERRLVPLGLALLAVGLALGALRRIDETESASRRWRKSLARVAVGAGLYAALVPFFAASQAEIPGPQWLTSEAEGRTLATTHGKPMLVDFSADWCVACKELEHDTFSDPRVIELAENFVTVRVDATDRTDEILALERTYGIIGLPWVVFVTPEGTVLDDLTVTGFIDADAMLERMQRALPPGAAAAASTTP